MSEPAEHPGPDLLADFIRTKDVSYRDAGDALHVTHATVWQWTHRERLPTPSRRADIETWTGGAVPATSWGPLPPQVVPLSDDAEA